ncbi:hypothetical protein HMPREF9065_01906 [Aggregatibacter sp. oral taxon 458 str. W10330]|nr:hypothetical protein HMPREF9065_01906 [Aggregatibacter sp. oral taxon 458 str. W10330]
MDCFQLQNIYYQNINIFSNFLKLKNPERKSAVRKIVKPEVFIGKKDVRTRA